MVARECHIERKRGAVVGTGTPSDVWMTGGGKASGESYDVYLKQTVVERSSASLEGL